MSNNLRGLMIVLALSLSLPPGAWSTPDTGTKVTTNADAPSSAPKHMGVASCASSSCHGRAAASDRHDISLNEYRTWSRYDHHSRAFKTLQSRHSQRIASNMGLADASKAPACLACHAQVIPAEQMGERFHLSDGIGCESCHGGAERWLDNHYGANASHQTNLDNGLWPTEQSRFVAELCQRCHLGDTEQLANHEMMAAGHPRLRFELDTWMALMPAHHVVDEDYQQRKPPDSATQRWITGRYSAALGYLELLVQHANGKNLIPELVIYDCHSCHRPMDESVLRSPVDRQLLPAGALRLNDNTLRILAEIIAVRDRSAGKALKAQIRRLHRASTRSAAELRRVANAIKQQLEATGKITTDFALTDTERHQLQRALLREASAGHFRDYADAEQLFLALQLLAGSPSRDTPPYPGLFSLLDNENRFRPRAFAQEARRLLSLEDAQ